MSIRVHELAKLLGRPSKLLIDQAHAIGILVKSHQSVLEDDEAVQLKNALPPKAPKPVKKPAVKKAPARKAPAKKARAKGRKR